MRRTTAALIAVPSRGLEPIEGVTQCGYRGSIERSRVGTLCNHRPLEDEIQGAAHTMNRATAHCSPTLLRVQRGRRASGRQALPIGARGTGGRLDQGASPADGGTGGHRSSAGSAA